MGTALGMHHQRGDKPALGDTRVGKHEVVHTGSQSTVPWQITQQSFPSVGAEEGSRSGLPEHGTGGSYEITPL